MEIIDRSCSTQPMGKWMQLKAICFGRSPIKSDASHEEVDENKVLGIDIEFLKQQFFMHPSIEFDTPVTHEIIAGF